MLFEWCCSRSSSSSRRRSAVWFTTFRARSCDQLIHWEVLRQCQHWIDWFGSLPILNLFFPKNCLVCYVWWQCGPTQSIFLVDADRKYFYSRVSVNMTNEKNYQFWLRCRRLSNLCNRACLCMYACMWQLDCKPDISTNISWIIVIFSR